MVTADVTTSNLNNLRIGGGVEMLSLPLTYAVAKAHLSKESFCRHGKGEAKLSKHFYAAL